MSKDSLRHYADLASLVDLLTEKRITLRDPQNWDDKNDSYFLRVYREKRKLKTVLALCFSMASERYHHWRVFAHGSNGVCVHFKRNPLIRVVERHARISSDKVTYRTLERMSAKRITIRELPFFKRYAFKDDEEFRIIYESYDDKIEKLDIQIPLAVIDRVTLSPWLPDALSDSLKNTLRSIPGCSSLHVSRSSLINNEDWKGFGDAAK